MAKRIIDRILHTEPVVSTDVEIDPDEVIEKIREGYVEKGKDRDGFKQRDSFTPSGLTYGSGHCPRMWYLWFEGNDGYSSNDWYSVANMDSGTDRHGRIETAMEHAGILVSKELAIKYEDPPISGKTDAIINWKGVEVLTEIKTMNDEAYHRTRKPRKYHIEQVLIYMKIMKKSFAYLIYESKNTHDIKMFPVRLTQQYKDFINYFFDWMKEVRAAFENNQLPENPYRNKYNSKVCKSCDFIQACQSKPEGDIKIPVRREIE